MNFLIFCSLFCLLFTPLPSVEYAIKFVTPTILVQYGSQSFSSINELANVSLFGTKVQGMTYIDGLLNASNAQLGDVVVNGNAYLFNCSINGNISVYGNLQMQNCKVTGEISTYDSLLSLDKTTASSLVMLNDQGQQTIVLQNGTLINGPVIFRSGNGLVNVLGASYIAGVLQGGRLK